MTEAPLFVYGTAALLGVVSHIAYFNRSEHHLYATRYMQLFALIYALGVFLLTRLNDQGLLSALSSMAVLAASLLTYRAFLHPLNQFPGPFAARLSAFWLTLHTRRSQAYKTLHELHQQHGPFVRVGSNGISIAHPDAVPLIYGFGSRCTKGDTYDNDKPFSSMHTTRDRAFHDARRRVWGSAFNDKAVRGYETQVQRLSTVLVRQLGAFGGGAVDVSAWFNYYAYDAMGHLAFGKSFSMLESGQEHFVFEVINEGLQVFGLMLPAWAFRLLAAIPGASASYWKFFKYCSDQLEERMKTKPVDPDIMSALIEPLKGRQPTEAEYNMLQADARLIIVAGSDTTAATLTHVFYYLASQPAHQARILAELHPQIQPDGSIRHRDLQDLPHLNGVINEALRLHPVVPTAMQRVTPPEGLTIAGTHVPGNSVVLCPAYTISRSADAYVEPELFCPERWYDEGKRGWVRKEKAFAPFSTGVYGCIGRPLAMMEMRLVVAKVLAAFEVGLAEGETGEELMERSKDHVTLECAKLKLTFKERST